MARLSQTNLTDDQKAQAKRKLDAAAKEMKIGEFSNEINLFNSVDISGHDAVIQKLDTWRNYVDPNTKETRQLYYGKDNFSETESLWEKVPIIRAKAHLNDKLYSTDPDKALKEINAINAGTISETRIPSEGSPRLMTKFSFTDKKTEELLKSGKLSLSTSFNCRVGEDGKLIGKVKPKHILLFEQDKFNTPQDQGVMFLNKSENDIIFYSREEPTLTETPESPDFEAEITNLKNMLGDKDSKIETLQNELNSYRTAEAERKKLEAEARWEKISNMIPAGILEKDGEEMKARYESNPENFAVELGEILINKTNETDEEGNTFSNSTNAPSDDDEKAADELKELTGR
mgnify:CR=1 FL=1